MRVAFLLAGTNGIKIQNIDGTLIPTAGNDENEMKRYKGLNYFKKYCPIFRFAVQTFLRG